MVDIHVSYKIETVVEGYVKPGDEIKGKIQDFVILYKKGMS